MSKKRNNGIVGKFFHSYDGEVLHWQGQILSKQHGEHYLVQLYEWLAGSPTDQVLVPFKDMTTWKFYDCTEDMNLAYDKYSSRRRQSKD
jgi:hypothetical protein